MPTPAELEELAAAEEAEKAAAAWKPFVPLGSAPSDGGAFSTPGSIVSPRETSIARSAAQREPTALHQYVSQLGSNLATAAEKTGLTSAAGQALGLASDLGESIGTLRRYPARVAGNVMAGETPFKGSEAAGAKTDLLAPLRRLAYWNNPLMIPEPKSGQGLSGQTIKESVEALSGPFETTDGKVGLKPDVSGWDAARMIGGGLAGLSTEVLSMPGAILPGVGNPAEALASKAVSFATKPTTPLPAVPGLMTSRRGVLNLGPRENRPTDLAMKTVYDAAHKIVDPAGWETKEVATVGGKKGDRIFAMTNPAIQSEEELFRLASMDETALRQALLDNERMVKQAERRATPMGRAADIGEFAESQTERTLLRDLAGEETKEVVSRAPRFSTEAERVAHREAAVSRVLDQAATHTGPLEEGSALDLDIRKALDTDGTKDVIRGLGGTPTQDKGKNVGIIRELLESKVAQNETKIDPTTPIGRQMAEEEDFANLADEVKVFEPDAPPATAQAPGGPPSAVPAPAPSPPAPGGGAPMQGPTQVGRGVSRSIAAPRDPIEDRMLEFLNQQIPKQPPVRTQAPTAGAWQGVDRPPPIGPSGPTTPAPPRRAPIQGPARRPQAAPERYDTGFPMNHVDSLQNASRRANNPAGLKLAEDIRNIVVDSEASAAKPVAEINKATAAAGKNPSALQELSDIITPAAWERLGAGDLKVGKFQGLVDSDATRMLIDPSEVAFKTKEANDLARTYVKVMSETGREAERIGVKFPSGAYFVSRNGRLWTQQLDPSAYAWMQDGNPDFEKLARLYKRLFPEKDVKAIRESLLSAVAQPIDRPAAFEKPRDLFLPAAMVGVSGDLKPILRYLPVPSAIHTESPIAQLVKSQWTRLAGIKRLGQDVTTALADDPKAMQGLISKTPLGQALAAGGEDVVSASNAALSALYRRPSAGLTGANPATWKLSTSRGTGFQWLRGFMNRIVPALNLGLQGVKSIPQFAVEVPSMTGAMNTARGLVKSLAKYGPASEEARQAGALSEKFLMAGSEVFDRHRLAESVFAANANRFPTERFNDFVKDFEDTIAFTAGNYKAEQMLSGKVKRSDFLKMDELNIPQKFQDVFRNPSKFPAEDQAAASRAFAHAVAKESQLHARNPAMKGWIENDPTMRHVAPYISFTLNTGKRTLKDVERIWKASRIGVDPDANMFSRFMQRVNPFGAEKEPLRNAVQRLLTRVFGVQIAGELVGDVSSAFQGKDPLRRDRSALGRFLENLYYVSFLGPFQFAIDQIGAHFLEGKEAKEAEARARPFEFNNPALGAITDAAKELGRGDVAGAAGELTIEMAPAIKGAARASGLMEPAGPQRKARPAKPHAFLQSGGGARSKHPFLEGGGGSRRHPLLDGSPSGRKHPFLK